MNSGYRYGAPSVIKDFKCIRTAAIWAGGFGVLQSIVWMALTIVGIIAYNCIILPAEPLNFGNVVESVFDNLYFRGNCKQPAYNLDMQRSLNPVLDPEDILIWNCVYLGVAFCWLISSGLLFIYIKKDDAKLTAGILLNWVFFTFCICLMDCALGIIFGIDYGSFKDKATGFNLDPSFGTIEPSATQVLAATIAAISLMIISFKGFLLWIINFVLMIYLLVLGIRILKDKDNNDTLFMPRKDSDDILTTRPPIKAYEEDKTVVTSTYAREAYTNEAFVSDGRSMNTIELNEEPLQRAARMSTDASLQDRRFRNIDAFQQFPPPRYNSINNNTNNNNISNVNLNNNKPQRLPSTKENEVVTTGFPVPDYSPPMTRANQNPSQNGGILRNHRY